MGRTEELSDFKRGTVIGCHLGNKSVREISVLLDLPRSTVSAIIVKWKRVGATTAQPRSGRPRKITERGRRVLTRVVEKNRLSSLASLTTEFQTASGSKISTRTVRRELCEMGFRGQDAVHKPHNNKEKAVQPQSDKVPLHAIAAGDLVMVKSFSRKAALEPKWKGPFKVLRTTNRAVKVAEIKSWIYMSNCKLAPPETDPVTEKPKGID
ncbi:uncharacterized protein LOC128663958 [Bombina bombina]|uniref:uncharacterized protein LOC128663958 n=1 Tax=Bombina bombina TaxID=8345 RepID=UPI00235A8A8E|nr:uncharacterized protein LOC128663958 [Bombina bombina]XP_053574544.1 uncharacterized protein LOC128663958 [Bombina bombina]